MTVPPSEAQSHPTWTDLPRHYTHAQPGPGPSKKISELRETLIPSPLFKLWLHEHSGQAGIFLSGKIIGGHEAKPHSCPYMAFLQFKISGKSYICGGFLVREDFVLTAAHCLGR